MILTTFWSSRERGQRKEKQHKGGPRENDSTTEYRGRFPSLMAASTTRLLGAGAQKGGKGRERKEERWEGKKGKRGERERKKRGKQHFRMYSEHQSFPSLVLETALLSVLWRPFPGCWVSGHGWELGIWFSTILNSSLLPQPTCYFILFSLRVIVPYFLSRFHS